LRLPLQTTAKTRDGSLTKDTLISNGLVEIHKSGKAYTIKRPGLSVQAEGTGVANGAFWYDNTIYYWDENTPNNAPLTATYTLINGQLIFGVAFNSSTEYEQNTPVAALDPYTGEPTTFYPIGTFDDTGDGIPAPSTDPNSIGGSMWSTSVNDRGLFADSSDAYAAALAAASNRNRPTPVYSFPSTPTGIQNSAAVFASGTPNPPTVLSDAATVRFTYNSIVDNAQVAGYTSYAYFYF